MALESIYTIVTYEIVEKTFQSLNFKSNAIMTRQYNRTVLQQRGGWRSMLIRLVHSLFVESKTEYTLTSTILLTYFQSAMKQATEALFILSQFR